MTGSRSGSEWVGKQLDSLRLRLGLVGSPPPARGISMVAAVCPSPAILCYLTMLCMLQSKHAKEVLALITLQCTLHSREQRTAGKEPAATSICRCFCASPRRKKCRCWPRFRVGPEKWLYSLVLGLRGIGSSSGPRWASKLGLRRPLM